MFGDKYLAPGALSSRHAPPPGLRTSHAAWRFQGCMQRAVGCL